MCAEISKRGWPHLKTIEVMIEFGKSMPAQIIIAKGQELGNTVG